MYQEDDDVHSAGGALGAFFLILAVFLAGFWILVLSLKHDQRSTAPPTPPPLSPVGTPAGGTFSRTPSSTPSGTPAGGPGRSPSGRHSPAPSPRRRVRKEAFFGTDSPSLAHRKHAQAGTKAGYHPVPHGAPGHRGSLGGGGGGGRPDYRAAAHGGSPARSGQKRPPFGPTQPEAPPSPGARVSSGAAWWR